MTDNVFIDCIIKFNTINEKDFNEQILLFRNLSSDELEIYEKLKEIEFIKTQFKFQKLLQDEAVKNTMFLMIGQKSKMITVRSSIFNQEKFFSLLSQLKGVKNKSKLSEFSSMVNPHRYLIDWARKALEREKLFTLPTTFLRKENEYNAILDKRRGNPSLNGRPPSYSSFKTFFKDTDWKDIYYCFLRNNSETIIEIYDFTSICPPKFKKRLPPPTQFFHICGGILIDVYSDSLKDSAYFNRLEKSKNGFVIPDFKNDLKNIGMLKNINKENIVFLVKRDKPWERRKDKEIILPKNFFEKL